MRKQKIWVNTNFRELVRTVMEYAKVRIRKWRHFLILDTSLLVLIILFRFTYKRTVRKSSFYFKFFEKNVETYKKCLLFIRDRFKMRHRKQNKKDLQVSFEVAKP
jgi:hypothetical protein